MFQSLAAVEIWALISPKATSETLPKVSAEAVVWAKFRAVALVSPAAMDSP